MKKVIRSTLNTTPHVLAVCFSCGWQDADSMNAPRVRLQLFKHMRQNNCTSATIEVGRTSHYRMFNKTKD